MVWGTEEDDLLFYFGNPPTNLPTYLPTYVHTPLIGSERYPYGQCGFRASYSTTDNIFVIHALIEYLRVRKLKLYCAFIDFTKAFDNVWRVGLWGKLLSYNRARKLYTSARIYEWKFGKGEWKLPFASPTGRVDFFWFCNYFEKKRTN